MISLDASFVPSDDAVFRNLAGEAVVLDLASGRYFGLDPVGTRIWELIASGSTLRDVQHALLAEFDVSPAALESDLLEFAGQLLDRRLLQPRP